MIVSIGIIIFPIITLLVWYLLEKERSTDQPLTFDLFIAQNFFEATDMYFLDASEKVLNRPVSWQVDMNELILSDSISLSLKNISGEKFYYTTWGAPFSRYHYELVVYNAGYADTIRNGGYGCHTGVYYAPLRNGKTMSAKIANPLKYTFTRSQLPNNSMSFPGYFKEVFGDSVAIRFYQKTYSNPWSKYQSQMLRSDLFIISTDEVNKLWEKNSQ